MDVLFLKAADAVVLHDERQFLLGVDVGDGDFVFEFEDDLLEDCARGGGCEDEEVAALL